MIRGAPGCGAVMTGQTSIKERKRYSVYRHPPARYKRGACTWQVSVADLDGDADVDLDDFRRVLAKVLVSADH